MNNVVIPARYHNLDKPPTLISNRKPQYKHRSISQPEIKIRQQSDSPIK